MTGSWQPLAERLSSGSTGFCIFLTMDDDDDDGDDDDDQFEEFGTWIVLAVG